VRSLLAGSLSVGLVVELWLIGLAWVEWWHTKYRLSRLTKALIMILQVLTKIFIVDIPSPFTHRTRNHHQAKRASPHPPLRCSTPRPTPCARCIRCVLVYAYEYLQIAVKPSVAAWGLAWWLARGQGFWGVARRSGCTVYLSRGGGEGGVSCSLVKVVRLGSWSGQGASKCVK